MARLTTSDAILKLIIEERGGRIKLEDVHKSHYNALGINFVYNCVRYEGKEIVPTEDGIRYFESLKSFDKKAVENLRL